MPVIDMKLNAPMAAVSTDDPVQQQKHASAPTMSAFSPTAEHLAIAIGSLMFGIYLLHAVERKVKA